MSSLTPHYQWAVKHNSAHKSFKSFPCGICFHRPLTYKYDTPSIKPILENLFRGDSLSRSQVFTHSLTQVFSNINLNHTILLPNMCPMFVQSLPNIFPIFAQYLTNINPIFSQYVHNICTIFIQHLSNICQIFPQN